ncbi:MAG: 3-deoxy-D-manno-octulosonic acid transferase [Candidatus Electrothrix communis]|nr:3-deoxy-D-manno-octulosonic acid transferase [Desulfobulbus sp. US4]WLE97811.1 MAG: 3-deoxy-D-manno-octulosonic acid transferase [Candidatus Electrothrix communis]
MLLVVLSRAKYRGRTLERLGLPLGKGQHAFAEAVKGTANRPVIWIHALSVGEVTSAVPLVKALRADMADTVIVLTVATSSGKKIAETLLQPYVQRILSSPFDLRFAVRRYITAFQPDIFIQVETDFWPNWLSLLQKQGVPTMLVNGRISEKSFAAYRRFAFFFQPMFCSFDLLSMQTEEDCRKITMLGVPADKVIALGNLKYDMERPAETEKKFVLSQLAEQGRFIWVCGSTHPGEEKYIFSAVAQLLARQDQQKIADQLFLVLAPRDINRGQELVDLAGSFGLEAGRRSCGEQKGRVLVLDTLGELAHCYSQAELAFVGGSLVRQGGHNPIEPAIHGVPVLFGPHMEDFSEIACELLDCEGGKMVTVSSLTETLTYLLTNQEARATMGQAAQGLVKRHRGGVQRHVQAIQGLLGLQH